MSAITPAAIATIATQNARLKAQREIIAARLERAERVSPSRTRVQAARSRGYRGPITRADLEKAVR
jgi:hypothetical protein